MPYIKLGGGGGFRGGGMVSSVKNFSLWYWKPYKPLKLISFPKTRQNEKNYPKNFSPKPQPRKVVPPSRPHKVIYVYCMYLQISRRSCIFETTNSIYKIVFHNNFQLIKGPFINYVGPKVCQMSMVLHKLM